MSDQTPHDPSSTPAAGDAWTQPNADAHGASPHPSGQGSPAEQPPAYGQPPVYGQQEQPGYGQQQGGQPSYGQNPYGQQPYGQNPYGQQPYAQNPYGQNPYAQQPYGQNPYSQPGAGPYPGSRSALAIVSMILGIVGVAFGFAFTVGLLPIAAVVTGFIARSRIKRYQQQGAGMALAGIITGFVGIAFTIGFIALYAVIIANAVNSGGFSGTGTGTYNP